MITPSDQMNNAYLTTIDEDIQKMFLSPWLLISTNQYAYAIRMVSGYP